MTEGAKKRKHKAFGFAGIILGAIFILTLFGNLENAHARGGFFHFPNIAKKWQKLYRQKHKPRAEAISIQCGDTIGPGGYYKLDADLDCSNFIPDPDSETIAALTVIGPVTLDFKGHSIIGNLKMKEESAMNNNGIPDVEIVDGILIDGERANIRNGTVKECFNGVVVDGDGHHKVFKMKALANDEMGFVVNSDYNRLTLNRSIDNLENGFYFFGSNNWFIKNRAENNDGEGFYGKEDAWQNKLYLNRAVSNDDEGFQIEGDQNRISLNLSKENDNDGITIDGNQNFVYKNKSFDNIKMGFEIDGAGNKIIKNRARQNQQHGIFVDDDSDNLDNVIKRNIAKENLITDIFVDIPKGFEELDACERQTWKKNRFDTSNVECIQ